MNYFGCMLMVENYVARMGGFFVATHFVYSNI